MGLIQISEFSHTQNQGYFRVGTTSYLLNSVQINEIIKSATNNFERDNVARFMLPLFFKIKRSRYSPSNHA